MDLPELLFERPDASTIHFTRRLPGGPRLIWRLWTDPHHLRQWWGPMGGCVDHCAVDLRPGGAWRIEFSSPTYGNKVVCGSYVAIEPDRRLVFTWGWEENGEVGHVSRVTLTFEEEDGACLFTLLHEDLSPLQAETHPTGWRSCLDGLARHAIAETGQGG